MELEGPCIRRPLDFVHPAHPHGYATECEQVATVMAAIGSIAAVKLLRFYMVFLRRLH